MKRATINMTAATIAAISISLLTGCATQGQREITGTIVGGAAGAGIGSALSGGSALGTAIGAVGGAVAGQQIGKHSQ